MSDRPSVIENLRREVDQICAGAGTWHDMTKLPDMRGYVPAPPDSRLRAPGTGSTQTPEERGPFGRWVLRQPEKGLLGKLIRAARSDPKWPMDGSPEDAATRLNECGAEGDMFAALEEAELDWLSY